MSAQDCIAAIVQAAGRELTTDELDNIVTEVQTRVRRRVAEGLGVREAGDLVGRELVAEEMLAAMIERRNAGRNALVKQALDMRAEPGREGEAIRAVLTGVEGPRRGLADSIDAQRHSILAGWTGPMTAELRRAGLLKVLSGRDKAFDRDVARELYRIDNPAAGDGTGNAHAAEAARIMHKYVEASRLAMNEAGAWIGKLDGYITRQSHDMMKVRGAGRNGDFPAWRDAILPKLAERTFDGLETAAEREAKLLGTWQHISSGVFDTSTSEALAGFKGPGNLAKKASQERVLHFKDADAWFDYNEQFGRGSLFASIWAGLENSSRSVALMRTLGTNPEAMFDGWVEGMAKAATDRSDFKAVDAIRAPGNRQLLDVVTGKTGIPGNVRLAEIGATVRNVQSMASLGGVLLSALPDLAVNAAMLRHNGIPMFSAIGRMVADLLPKGAERREVAEAMGAGIDGVLGGIVNRFRAEDSAMGRMSRMVEIFHRVNGLTWWTDTLKQSVGLMLSNNLGVNAGREFAALNRRLQTTLRRYGIEETEWNAMRGAAREAADGRVYLMADEIADPKLADKLRTYYIDQIREGMTEPTARGRATATMGTRAGTPAGELMRMLMQFKTYPITFMQRSLAREIYRDGVDVAGLATLIATTTALGYVSMTLKELAKGRNPREPEDAADYLKLVSAAMVQGGGMGLYGDFLFGDNNRFGGGLVSSLAGPTAGDIEAVAGFIAKMREGSTTRTRGEVAAAEGIKFAQSNIPFINLFYTKAAVDYLVVWRLQEMVNPGYLRRMEQRVKKDNDQTFFLRPTGAPSLQAPQVPTIFGGPQ
jgi:hypothetical protein